MDAPKTILVPLLLTAQALFVHWAASVEKPPAKADLSHFPDRIGAWNRFGVEPVDDATKAQLGADELMNLDYMKQPGGQFANLFVAWFQSQRAGTSQPHSPQVCLPASGWVPESTGLIDIPTRAGTITVNRYVIANGVQRAVVLYWYQTPRRVIANEWAAKFWLMADALRDRRTDTSLVRVTIWVTGNSDVAKATEAAREYSGRVYPLLKETLP
ncbi:MAG TPA: EpsI family protein [Bryobacteraceae bacterium]|nr:EpsI family protein [Bryobacteraceae bacterium]